TAPRCGWCRVVGPLSRRRPRENSRQPERSRLRSHSRERRQIRRSAPTASAAGATRSDPEHQETVSPSRIFILRPVATSLLMAAIMLVGMVAYRFLPLSALPEVDYPTIQVVTLYPGASPDVMTSSVTAPLEVQLGQMPG